MNKELKEYLEKEFGKMIIDFRIRLNDLTKIKNKIHSSGIDINTPTYLGIISKYQGEKMKDIFSYINIRDIYEENRTVMFDLMEINECIKNDYRDYPLNDIRFFMIALFSFPLSDTQYQAFLKYILSLISNHAIWHVNMFRQNYVIERKLASLIQFHTSVDDEYAFVTYVKDWVLSLFKEFPYVLDGDIVRKYFYDNKRLLINIMKLQRNQEYYLNDNTDLRPLNYVLPPLVAKSIEEKFKYKNFKNKGDIDEFMNEIYMNTDDPLIIQIYEARCYQKWNKNKSLVKKLQTNCMKGSSNS